LSVCEGQSCSFRPVLAEIVDAAPPIAEATRCGIL